MIKRQLHIIILLLTSLALASCSLIVRKVEIPQGNIITQEQISQLRPGMTKQQVLNIMGNPVLDDVFTNNRWTYINIVTKGKKTLVHEEVVIYFENNLLNHFNTSQLPSNVTVEIIEKENIDVDSE